MLVLCLFNVFVAKAVGFDGNMTVTISSGRLKPIKDLKVGDEVLCYDKDFKQESKQVTDIRTFMANSSMEISTEDNIILSSSRYERFFFPKEEKWVFAKDLKEGDSLLNENFDAVRIIKLKNIMNQKKCLL